MTEQKTIAATPSTLNKADNENNSGTPNLMNERVMPIRGMAIPR